MKTQGPEGSGTVVCLEGWKGSYWLGLSSGGQVRATRAGVVKGSWKFKNKFGFRELASYLLEMPVHAWPDPAGLQAWEASALGVAVTQPVDVDIYYLSASPVAEQPPGGGVSPQAVGSLSFASCSPEFVGSSCLCW